MNTVKKVSSGTADTPESSETAPNVPAEQLLVQQARALSAHNDADMDDGTASDKSLEMVRNILFGEQVRETEKRQAALERYIRVSIGALNEETQQQLDGLKGELSLLNELLEEEVRNRKTDQRNHSKRADKTDQKLDKLSQQLLENCTEINQRIDQEKQQLQLQMKDWQQDMLQQLQDVSTRLTEQKADRATMAKLLTAMADELVADDAADS